jgi:hypothetical protein
MCITTPFFLSSSKCKASTCVSGTAFYRRAKSQAKATRRESSKEKATMSSLCYVPNSHHPAEHTHQGRIENSS